MLRDAVQFEMKAKLFLFVTQHVAKYYEWDEIASEKVIEHFQIHIKKFALLDHALRQGCRLREYFIL